MDGSGWSWPGGGGNTRQFWRGPVELLQTKNPSVVFFAGSAPTKKYKDWEEQKHTIYCNISELATLQLAPPKTNPLTAGTWF